MLNLATAQVDMIVSRAVLGLDTLDTGIPCLLSKLTKYQIIQHLASILPDYFRQAQTMQCSMSVMLGTLDT